MKRVVWLMGLSGWLYVVYASIDLNQAIFSEKIKLPKGQHKATTALTMAKSFLGLPYVAHTLEKTPEQLVCNLSEFDCFTFVESVLALTFTRHHLRSYSQYQTYLLKMRYRNGQIEGYGSRLHYFLEWKIQGEALGHWTDMTASLGGVLCQPVIDFMSKHRISYPALTDEQAFQQVVESEQKLSDTPWYYIPKSRVAAIESRLNDGDIVGVTSAMAGLDFNHEGFVVKKGNRAYLLHASSEQKKVVIASEPLADYLNRIKKHSGIVVLRLNP
ncbi:MAG: N-acetylmuramoyl-L-alanine amidase-like domain-containing protein [Runella sp.]